MFIPQPPTLQIIGSAQPMLLTDMTKQQFPPIAAIQTNHIVVAYRLPHWHSGSENFLGLIRSSKLRKRSMH